MIQGFMTHTYIHIFIAQHWDLTLPAIFVLEKPCGWVTETNYEKKNQIRFEVHYLVLSKLAWLDTPGRVVPLLGVEQVDVKTYYFLRMCMGWNERTVSGSREMRRDPTFKPLFFLLGDFKRSSLPRSGSLLLFCWCQPPGWLWDLLEY